MWMKKRYILRHGEDQFTATLARNRRGHLAVQIDDGELSEIDVCFVQNGRALSLRRNGKMHLIDLTGIDNRGQVEATVAGRAMTLTVMDELHAMALDAMGDGARSGTVEAEIPGLVLTINVEVGQKVHQGEAILVLEAMKMQNEITAPLPGTVTDILVETSQSVNAGDVLLVIEPEAGG
jgi:biotin carboxyl carrier protein